MAPKCRNTLFMYPAQPELQQDSQNIVYPLIENQVDNNGPLPAEHVPAIEPGNPESSKTSLIFNRESIATPDPVFKSPTPGNLSNENEQHYNSVFENSFVGIVIANLQADIIEANNAFTDILGYSKAELAGKKLFSFIHHDDLDSYTEGWNNLVRNKTSSVTIEGRYLHKLLEIVWVRNSFSISKDSNGIPRHVMIVSVNINEEKHAQQKAEEVTRRFRFLADSMPQQIWTADANGNLNYFSHAFYEYSGMSFEDIRDSNWKNIVFRDDLENTSDQWKKSVATGEEFIIEHRLRRRDGSYTWQLSRAMAQRDNHGKIILWIGSSSNIHRQKTVEEELEKQVIERTHDLEDANFNLKHSNHDLEQFAYIATHDLQEPLRKIRTYSSWIKKRYINQLPDEAQEYIIKIENASERMSVLIDDLLNYSLLLRPQEAFELTDMDAVLNNVIRDFDLLITQKNAVIHTTPIPKLKVIPAQVHQLFYNLLSNALKFTSDDRQPVIYINSRVISQEEVIALNLDMDRTYLEIMFKDNGIGFRQEYDDRVFSIFQRLHNRSKYPGTGIGLALCKKIAIYHHGQIYAKAQENKGASFYIQLPLEE